MHCLVAAFCGLSLEHNDPAATIGKGQDVPQVWGSHGKPGEEQVSKEGRSQVAENQLNGGRRNVFDDEGTKVQITFCCYIYQGCKILAKSFNSEC